MKNIYGVHDYNDGIQRFNSHIWVTYTEAIGSDPNDMSGKNYNKNNTTAIVRINNGYGTGGTIPLPHHYDDFAKRCANFVKNSQGIEYIVIGNEIALQWEWPENQVITLENYKKCYIKCYNEIRKVNKSVKIAPMAVAPWNDSTPDAPDWIIQFSSLLIDVPAEWICLHSYTRDYSLGGFTTGERMSPPYQHRYKSWETLYEFMSAIPRKMRNLPVIITETNGNKPWSEYQIGWIPKLYDIINDWNNNTNNQNILAVCLFRWNVEDKEWDFSRYQNVLNDFNYAIQKGYTTVEKTQEFKPEELYVNQGVILRLRSKPTTESDTLAVLQQNDPVVTLEPESNGWQRVIVYVKEWLIGYVSTTYISKPDDNVIKLSCGGCDEQKSCSSKRKCPCSSNGEDSECT